MVKALPGQNAQFDFCDIQPTSLFWGVMDSQPFRQTSGFFRGKAFVQGRRTVGMQVIHHQHDLLRCRIPLVEHATDKISPFSPPAVFGNFYMASTGKWFYFKEYFRNAISDIFMVQEHWVPRSRRNRLRDISDQLLA